MMNRRQSGFSMIELMVVMGIGMVLIAMAVPLVSTTLNMYRLRGAGGAYANLLQTARMRAVSDDRYYPVYATPGTKAASLNSFNAFVDINGTGIYANAPLADPAVAFSPKILIPAGAAPNTINLNNQFLPGIVAGTVAINPNAWGPTFGARGLPCQATAASGGTCAYTSPAGQPIAFETFMQNAVSGMWEAVTVNPSGRVRQWQYDAGAGAWRPLN
jgi:type II secretory pathway pseudopilin PulG